MGSAAWSAPGALSPCCASIANGVTLSFDVASRDDCSVVAHAGSGAEADTCSFRSSIGSSAAFVWSRSRGSLSVAREAVVCLLAEMASDLIWPQRIQLSVDSRSAPLSL